jgi:hypothetical protein
VSQNPPKHSSSCTFDTFFTALHKIKLSKTGSLKDESHFPKLFQACCRVWQTTGFPCENIEYPSYVKPVTFDACAVIGTSGIMYILKESSSHTAEISVMSAIPISIGNIKKIVFDHT